MRLSSRALTATVLGLLLALPFAGTASGAAAGAAPDPVDVTQAAADGQRLPRDLSGKRALAALGDEVAETAALNGMTGSELRQLLTEDDTVHLDQEGRVNFVDPAPVTPGDSPATADAIALAAAADVPALSSRPTSTHKIYLDFDGTAVPSGNGWGITPGTYGGFSLDSDPDFSAAELTFIQRVWSMVAEKYAPWDLDVTTVDPGPAGYSRSTMDDVNYGTRVVITSDTVLADKVCATCAGRAYFDVFSDPGNAAYDPAWALANRTSGNAVSTALVVAHEVGHTLALDHDGGNEHPEYYSGHSNWVPIMGIATNGRGVGQFSKGEYDGANESEDDLAIIGANGNSRLAGSLLRADEGGGAPIPLAPATPVSGVINSRTDTDVYTVTTTCTAGITATATGVGAGQAVDLRVDILDTNDNLLATDPNLASSQAWNASYAAYLPTNMDATATLPNASPATYRIRVDGIGNGTGVTGYTDYGSIGQYTLNVSACADGGGATAPDAPINVTRSVTARSTTATVSWDPPADNGGSPITGWQVSVSPAIAGSPFTISNPATETRSLTGLSPGTTYAVEIRAVNAVGASPAASTTVLVPTWSAVGAPTVTLLQTTTSSARIRMAPSTVNPGNAVADGWSVTLRRGTTVVIDNMSVGSSELTFTSLSRGAYTAEVRQRTTSSEGAALSPVTSRPFSIVTKPSAPRIGTASNGTAGRPVNAIARWAVPTSNGGAAITGYRVYAYKLNSRNQVVSTKYSTMRPAGARSFVFPLAAGRYKFRVIAYNRIGASAFSAYSRIVTAR